MQTLKLTLVTPFKKVFENLSVEEVSLPAAKGQLTIYPDHSPLVTTLGVGLLRYREAGKSDFSELAISWGYCEIIKGKIKLLADNAVSSELINLEEERKNLKSLQERLDSEEITPEEISKTQKKIKESEAKLGLLHS